MIDKGLVRSILLYGAILAVAAVALQWLELQFLARTYPLEIYVGLIAVGFLALGAWAGARLFRKAGPAGPGFVRNDQVIVTLGLSNRELEVLDRLAAGRSNKEIATELNVSPNTVKTHVSRLYEKLEASRRTEAILKARQLGILP